MSMVFPTMIHFLNSPTFLESNITLLKQIKVRFGLVDFNFCVHWDRHVQFLSLFGTFIVNVHFYCLSPRTMDLC